MNFVEIKTRKAWYHDMQTPVEEESELEQGKKDSHINEIILILTLLVSIFSLISILGIGGIVGKYFCTFIFGTMGLLGYFFPFVLFFAVVLIVSNYKNKRILSRIFCCIGIYFILMGFFQLLFYPNSDLSMIEMYFHCAKTTLGGGLFGTILTMPLRSVLGVTGTFLILLAVFFLLLIFITSRFLLSMLGKKKKKNMKKMHLQSQAERIEKIAIGESYQELSLKKRGASITFDLSQDNTTAGSSMEETIPVTISSSVPVSIAGDAEEIELSPKSKQKTSNVISIEDVKRQKENRKNLIKIKEETKKVKTGKIEKKIEKQPEMKEYEPSVEEKPITKNTKEIREELEQSLFAEDSLEQEYILKKPSIRFVNVSEESNYVRKVIDEPIEKLEEKKDI